ncbi:MAG: DUF4935 domain-containing protein [Candidatus Obscuribacter phosphatis]|uniref:DUF4935 domain-containing protein n=1 Tax=Candidatus Obscuribacter phosphatis TaxID=1906157 RepID=A0A8J7TNJ4_9BACT|nr:DUF4935 domain-containing protein [Candidatus Obscuribacter phosphatis]
MSYVVVFDTCSLEKNLNPSSRGWDLFRRWRLTVNASVCLARVTWIELRKHIKASQNERISRILNACFDDSTVTLFSLFDKPEDIENFKKKLLDDIERNLDDGLMKHLEEVFGVRPAILPDPEISHGDLLAKYYDGDRKPYNNRKSYQDTVLWESVLQLLSTAPAKKVVFISNNSKDFGEAKSRSEAGGESQKSSPNDSLHSDLKEDVIRIRQAESHAEHVDYYSSLDSAVGALYQHSGSDDSLDAYQVDGDIWKRLQGYIFSGGYMDRSFLLGYLKAQFFMVSKIERFSWTGFNLEIPRSTPSEALIEISRVQKLNDNERLIHARTCAVLPCNYVVSFRTPVSGQEAMESETIKVSIRMDFEFLFNRKNGKILSAYCVDAKLVEKLNVAVRIRKVFTSFEVSIKQGDKSRAEMKELSPESLKQVLGFLGLERLQDEIDRIEVFDTYTFGCPKPVLDFFFPEVEEPLLQG